MSTKEEIYRIICEHGERMNFNVGIYDNETDKSDSKLARKLAERFTKTFLEPLAELDLQLSVGMQDIGGLGNSVFLAVTKKDSAKPLLVLACPHNIIDIHSDEVH